MLTEQTPRQKLENLTNVQRQILSYYCEGCEYGEIGEKLSYSPNTVKKYLREIRSILGIDVNNNTKLRAILYTEYCPELKQLKVAIELDETTFSERGSALPGEENWFRFFTRLPVRPIRWILGGVLSIVILLVAFFLVLGVLIGQNNSRNTAAVPFQVVGIVPVTEAVENTVQEHAPVVEIPPGSLLIDDFETGINDWYAARKDMGENQAGLAVHPSAETALGKGALKCVFDFNLTTGYDPVASCFRVNLPVEDWTRYTVLQFQAKSLVDLNTNIRVFIALLTGSDSCWNELGDFQYLGLEYQTFTFDLDRPLYKTCEDPGGYDEEAIGKEQIVRLHLLFTAEHKPMGAVLVDEIRLLEK